MVVVEGPKNQCSVLLLQSFHNQIEKFLLINHIKEEKQEKSVVLNHITMIVSKAK